MNASPETLGHLTAIRDQYFSYLLWSSGAVAIGVALEGPEVIHEARKVFCGLRKRAPAWVTLVALIGWMLVAIGVLGEGISEALLSHADGNIQAFNDQRLRDATDEAGDAKISAEKAASAAGSAGRSASSALTLARGARQEADTFEKRIGAAEQKAGVAESHVDAAFRQATAATEALNRIRSPRALTNIPELVARLEVFKGTEYTFSNVFQDEESVDLLKQIDTVLQRAEWKRVKPHSGSHFVVNIYGTAVDFVVPTGLNTGVRVSVESPVNPASLLGLPVDQMPQHVRAAVGLNESLWTNISPPEETAKDKRVTVQSGDSKTVQIAVGKKP